MDSARITPYRDGPYIIRGDFSLMDQDGNEIDPGRGTIALCRCGRSQIRPFCDGTHKLIGFRADGASERPGDAA
ncbi:MAG TPA: CDGSH iron-sulfur domain-containing protein [Thermoleophilaceae bacterium]|nr:CDGSH iron-sulfur domain-containing protein [Thermoleophilaceae bacterium]